jgi:endoglucanase
MKLGAIDTAKWPTVPMACLAVRLCPTAMTGSERALRQGRAVAWAAFSIFLVVCACGAATASPPPAIRIDQVAYPATAPKRALVLNGKQGTRFRLLRQGDHKEVFRGRLGELKLDPLSSDRVSEADLGALKEEGRYIMTVDGLADSVPISIGRPGYDRALYLTLRSFYGQRCGTAVDLAPSHPGYRYPACHLADALFHVSSGQTGRREATGGWHDAGDYGKYIVNSNITVGELLWAYELYREPLDRLRLDIPESENAIPDILDEVRWNLAWMLTMQDTDGGVWHKLTSERFGSFTMPENDDAGPRYIMGTGAEPYKSSCATAGLAAAMAIAARVYAPHDAAFAQRCRQAAEAAWGWVERNPSVVFRNCCGVRTGEYGDARATDDRLWAAAELWRTTREARYDKAFRELYRAEEFVFRDSQGWQDVGNLALVAYALSDPGGEGAPICERIRSQAGAVADGLVSLAGESSYRACLRPIDYHWGSNGVVAERGVILLLAQALAPRAGYVETALDQLHHLFGANTFSTSWVSQLGFRSVEHLHHRPSAADQNAASWPGLLSGGPNASGDDKLTAPLKSGPPARAWLDDERSYASNENAINWNASLVLLLTGALHHSR